MCREMALSPTWFYFILYFHPTCISSISPALRNVSGPEKCILLFANFPPSFPLWRGLDRILHSGIPSNIFTTVSVSSGSQSRTPPWGADTQQTFFSQSGGCKSEILAQQTRCLVRALSLVHRQGPLPASSYDGRSKGVSSLGSLSKNTNPIGELYLHDLI